MNIQRKVVNNLRVFASEVIANAKSGHSGIVLSSAPILYTLFAKHLKSTPNDPKNILRDRFVLSAGHGSALLYSLMHFMGYNISLDDLKNFRKLGSVTSGHPEYNADLGIECTTGPLGQGIATAVGMALGLKMLQSRFSKDDINIFDNKVYTLVGEGCLMEGVSYEALSLAGTLNLNNLIVLFDSNGNTLDSDIKNTFATNIKGYVSSLGFEYILVKNGNDVISISNAIKKAKQSKKPAFIEVKTILGFGSELANSNKSHGLVMSDTQINELRQNLGVFSEKFEVEDVVKQHFDNLVKNNNNSSVFNGILSAYKERYPKEFNELLSIISGKFIPLKLDSVKLDKQEESTRNIASIVLNNLCEKNTNIVGGNADLSSCTKAFINDTDVIKRNEFAGKNIFYGIREFGMACMANGLQLVGFKTFAGTFMVFSDYMRNAIRSSAIMGVPVTYILSHDSIAVGEDGPTHQPIEQLDAFRLMPNLNVWRPSNIEETICAYNMAFSSTTTPNIIALTRQSIPLISSDKSELKNISKGGYIIAKEKYNLTLVILATGSEVPIALQAKKELEGRRYGVRVVSVPCMENFEKQTKQYKESIVPSDSTIKKICIEASTGLYWKNIVSGADIISVNQFGLSGSKDSLYEQFELTVDKIIELAKKR